MTDAATPAAATPRITIEEFRKIQLRTGKVLEVADHPNADRLYVLKVDLGGGDLRQLVAGIKPYQPREELVGRIVVVVANLQPAMLRGVESNGMILAATGGGTVSVLVPIKDVPPGSPVT